MKLAPDSVVISPPPEPRVSLSQNPLNIEAAEQQVMSQACGAVTLFCGRIRDHNEGEAVTGIHYEAYETMALQELRDIVTEADQLFPQTRSVAHHRLGDLSIGDAAVVVAVAAPHRKVTFTACAWIIDQLKARVPIFKHERRESGVTWVGLGP